MKHGNIALFVPHNGCPNQCSFCNQKSITGKQYQPTPQDVRNAVTEALSSSEISGKHYDYEIAFFGGSFTAVDRDYMVSLLECAYEYVKDGTVSGIRLSTRPDKIDTEVLDILKAYGVTSIELGAQSMCDEVLSANKRGHTAKDVRATSRLIKKYGFSLGLQMMTGLYKSSDERDVFTAKEIISLSPDTVRIYPTVTVEGTPLARLLTSGEYIPPKLTESVNLCATLLQMFTENNIEVIRLGLHCGEELEKGILSDNYHPAFKELCESKLMLEKTVKLLESLNSHERNQTADIFVSPRSVSKLVGQKRSNILKLADLGYKVKVRTDSSLGVYDVKINVPHN